MSSVCGVKLLKIYWQKTLSIGLKHLLSGQNFNFIHYQISVKVMTLHQPLTLAHLVSAKD